MYTNNIVENMGTLELKQNYKQLLKWNEKIIILKSIGNKMNETAMSNANCKTNPTANT